MKITTKIAIFLGLLYCSFPSFSQTSPVPFQLGNSNLVFDGMPDGGTKYPNFIQGWKGNCTAHIAGTAAPTTNQPSGDAPLASSGEAADGISVRNEGENGISVRGDNSGNTPNSIVFAINTIGAKGMEITWTATNSYNFSNTQSTFHLQYRIGNNGDWTNLEGNSYITSTQQVRETFGPTALPADLEEQSLVQLRWIVFRQSLGGVSFTTSDRAGVDDLTITTTDAVPQPPIADFESSKRFASVDEPIIFNDKSTGNPSSYFWDFGDDSTSTEQNPVHTYSKGGYYTISLIVDNGVGIDTVIKDSLIEVIGPITADFSADFVAAKVNDTISFSHHSGSQAEAFTWEFGDGTFSEEANPKKSYSQNGSYTISLIVYNGSQESDTLVKENYITISDNPPTSITHNTFEEISVYPIPATTQLSWNPKGNFNLAEIYDLQGRILKSTPINSNHLNVSELSAGAYILKLKGNQKASVSRILIQ
ncbi:MAG: PKD repeat protein [Sphingobacteriales bacterium]|jgi:PKD repeat protein